MLFIYLEKKKNNLFQISYIVRDIRFTIYATNAATAALVQNSESDKIIQKEKKHSYKIVK